MKLGPQELPLPWNANLLIPCPAFLKYFQWYCWFCIRKKNSQHEQTKIMYTKQLWAYSASIYSWVIQCVPRTKKWIQQPENWKLKMISALWVSISVKLCVYRECNHMKQNEAKLKGMYSIGQWFLQPATSWLWAAKVLWAAAQHSEQVKGWSGEQDG